MMLANVLGIGHDALMDFAQAGLLDGLEGPEREQREQLLTRLADDGFSLDELRRPSRRTGSRCCPSTRCWAAPTAPRRSRSGPTCPPG